MTATSPTWAAVALGACFIERHLTLDQAASVEIIGMHNLGRNVHDIERALGDGVKRVYPSEQKVIEKLRRVKAPLNGHRSNGNGHLNTIIFPTWIWFRSRRKTSAATPIWSKSG